ncbi:MAG: MOSC domain-containing protein [Pseudobdellovibrio sp.]
MKTARVTGLYIYPVKSCRSIPLTELKIDHRGPVMDRQWVIVDEQNQFQTLRTNSKFAEILTSVDGTNLYLQLGRDLVSVKLHDESKQVEDVTIWGETFKAGIENPVINEALSNFLNKKVKLARYQSQSFRDLGKGATDFVKETMFSDSRPILLVNQASFNDLNQKLADKSYPLSQIQRFRPNIIVEGLEAYEEEAVAEFKIGNLLLKQPKLCGRCPVVTQEVETGKVVSKETLKVLVEDRKKPDSNKIPFGVYLTPGQQGSIKIGDQVLIQI